MARTDLIVRSRVHIEGHLLRATPPAGDTQAESKELPPGEEPFYKALTPAEQTPEQEALFKSERGRALFEHLVQAGGARAHVFEHFLKANVENRPVFEHFLFADAERRRVFEHFLVADPSKAAVFEHFLGRSLPGNIRSSSSSATQAEPYETATYVLKKPHVVSRVTVRKYPDGNLVISLEE